MEVIQMEKGFRDLGEFKTRNTNEYKDNFN